MGDPVHAGRGRWSIEAQLRDALRRARLLDWVESLPHGLQTLVGERGGRLSGGQRRRLALARALLADFPVLVADEPTEHLDDETARVVTADLFDATRDRAVLLITHQPFGLDLVDDVVRLPAGKPDADGTQAADEPVAARPVEYSLTTTPL